MEPGRRGDAREVYATRGDNRKAIEHLTRFVELWDKAEPEPQVKEVRGRLGQVRAKAG